MKRINELKNEVKNYVESFNKKNNKNVQLIFNDEERLITIIYYSMPMYVDIRDICDKYSDLGLYLDSSSSWGYIGIEY